MQKILFLLGLIGFITGCALSNTTKMNNTEKSCRISSFDKSTACSILSHEKTPACYITTGASGCIIISYKKPACNKNAVCTIPACSSVINYTESGKIIETKTPCPQ